MDEILAGDDAAITDAAVVVDDNRRLATRIVSWDVEPACSKRRTALPRLIRGACCRLTLLVKCNDTSRPIDAKGYVRLTQAL